MERVELNGETERLDEEAIRAESAGPETPLQGLQRCIRTLVNDLAKLHDDDRNVSHG